MPNSDGPGEEELLPAGSLLGMLRGLREYPFACWSFGDSIGFEALALASKVLKDLQYAGFAHGFFRSWLAQKRSFRARDATLPGHALCSIYEECGDPLLLTGLLRFAEWLLDRPRVHGVFASEPRADLGLPAGVYDVTPEEVDLAHRPGAGVFVDCLHLDPPFLAHLGRLVSDESLLQVAVDQALGSVALLWDEGSGLFHHFVLERSSRPYVLGWSRGQGWALLGLIDLLAYLPHDHEAYGRLASVVAATADAMKERQLENGGWPSLLDSGDNVAESSAAAFMAIAFSRGVRSGLLSSDEYTLPGRRAWNAVRSTIDVDGYVRGVSADVHASTRSLHYRRVAAGMSVPWGLGAAVLAALEWRSDRPSRSSL